MKNNKRKDFIKHVQDMEDFVRIDFHKGNLFDYQALKDFLSRFGAKGLRLGENGLTLHSLGTIFALRYNSDRDGISVSDSNLIRGCIQMLSVMVDEPRRRWREVPCCDWFYFSIVCSMQECVNYELYILKQYGFLNLES